MHADEIETAEAFVRRLLAAQFPGWAGLPIRRVQSSGTDNAIYRLGDDLAVRLPRIHWATEQVGEEFRWLPKLAPRLPLALPVPVARGEPGEGYPWAWGIYTWLEGENATPERLSSLSQAAVDLAGFILALQRIDPAGGPLPEPLHRGVPLVTRDAFTREHIARLPTDVDAGVVTAAWEQALGAPGWDGPPVWIHGDLQAGNLLAAGDPACELAVAWKWLNAGARPTFRAALACDGATWARGRGWALSIAVAELAYYQQTNPVMAASARRTLAEVLADHER